MSVEFTLNDSTLTLADWDRLVEEANDWDLNDHEEPVFSESGIAHLLVPGSIRGVLLYHGGSGELITLRLGALASRADWRAAYALAEAALAGGGGSWERESGERYEAGALSEALADSHAYEDFLPSVGLLRGNMLQHGPEVQVELPLGRFNLGVKLSELPEDFTAEQIPALEEQLAARVERYARAFRASTLVLEEGGVRVGTWALIPTLLGPVHLIACSSFPAESGLVPADALADLLGARAERFGDGGFFLPELELEAEPELKAQLEALLVHPTAWAEANAERLEREAQEAAEAMSQRAGGQDAGEFEAYRGLLTFVMAGVAQDVPPEGLFSALEERGVPQDIASTVVNLVGMTLGRLFGEEQEPRDPQEVFAELSAEGVPAGLAALTLEVITGLLRGPEGEAPE